MHRHSGPLDGDGGTATPLPASSWTKARIVGWLADRGVTFGVDPLEKFTKAELLDIVADYLDEETDG